MVCVLSSSPRGFGFARQAMVAPVIIKWDEKSVAERGKVVIRGGDCACFKDWDSTRRSTNTNGITGFNQYEVEYAIPTNVTGIPCQNNYIILM